MNNPLAITAIVHAAPEAPLVLRGELPQCIRQAKALGYDAVEIHVIEAPTFPMAEVKAALQETGLHISAIVTGRIFTERGLCITSPDPQNRAAAMAEMRDYIDIAAARSECSSSTFLSSWATPGPKHFWSVNILLEMTTRSSRSIRQHFPSCFDYIEAAPFRQYGKK